MSRQERDEEVQLGVLNAMYLGRVVRMTFGDAGVVQGPLLAVGHEPGEHGPRTELEVKWWDGQTFTFAHDSVHLVTVLARPSVTVEPVDQPEER